MSPIMKKLDCKLESVRTQIDQMQEELLEALNVLDESSLVTVTELNAKV